MYGLLIFGQFVGKPRIQKLGQQRRRRDKFLFVFSPERLCQKLVRVVRKAGLLTACSAVIQCDGFWFCLVDYLSQLLTKLVALRHHQLVMISQPLFVIPDHRDPFELVAAIDENEHVATADNRHRRNKLIDHRVALKLFINDDPHFDALPFHHRLE